MLEWLQEWYKDQCDNNWEHNHGIKIDTLDNPGWDVEIDVNDTNFNLKNSKWKLFELNNDKWVGYKIDNNIFYASSDPLKLSLIIKIFKFLLKNGSINDEIINKELQDT